MFYYSDTHNDSSHYLESTHSGNINNTNETHISQTKIVLSLGKLLSSKENEVERKNISSECLLKVEPPDDLHDINTNDLETLIETKQYKMGQLKAEESALIQRRRAYSTSIENHMLIENDTADVISVEEKLFADNTKFR